MEEPCKGCWTCTWVWHPCKISASIGVAKTFLVLPATPDRKRHKPFCIEAILNIGNIKVILLAEVCSTHRRQKQSTSEIWKTSRKLLVCNQCFCFLTTLASKQWHTQWSRIKWEGWRVPERLIQTGPAHTPTALYSAGVLSSLVAVLCNGGRVRCMRGHCVSLEKQELWLAAGNYISAYFWKSPAGPYCAG